ncbi:VWA domain-containing protein [Corynebacterium sp. CCM 9186]|uniref:vWA domain-containing protein n=1 Tax=Corynebacterium meridianum TaxID=2765363 RepID=UPI002002E022|nr:vWA domain-containing protein [Corynebacterium meridianum]MCK7677707.1 VWA domain-containing protein [Corynebacterium meridianum]
MSEQQNRNIFADGVTVTMKRIFVLVSVVALLVAVMAVQSASADEAETVGPTGVGVTVDGASAPPADTSGGQSTVPDTGAGPVEEPVGPLIDPSAELNEPTLQTAAPPKRLPQEYEDALADWPVDEAGDFREYYLAHPDELEFIEIERLVRHTEPVAQNFGVRAASDSVLRDPSKECGLKVAMVFDVSASMNDGNGIGTVKTVGAEVVNRFRNTPTQLGLYNFAGEANVIAGSQMDPVTMNDANADTAISKINALSAPNTPNSDPASGTNWAAGLEQVAGKGFDVVFFITDGVPTRPGGAGVQGPQANIVALKQAQDQAEVLKAEGVSVVSVFIGDVHPNHQVLVPYCSEPKPNQGYCGTVSWANGGGNNTPFISTSQRPTGLTYTDRTGSGSNRIVPVNRLNEVQCREALTFSTDLIPEFHSQNACKYNSKEVWTEVSTDEARMTESIASEGKAIQVDNFSQLSAVMAENTRGCEGTITLRKKIVDSENNENPSVSKKNWEFSAQKAIGDSGPVSDQIKRTDESGRVIYRFASKNGESVGNMFTLTETPREGYSLRQKNFPAPSPDVTCTQYDSTGQEVGGTVVNPIAGNPNAFSISPLQNGNRFSCTVVNAPALPENVEVSLKKRVSTEGSGFSDADEKTEQAALNLGSDNARFSLELEVENTGDVPLGYLEFTDRQLEVPEDTPVSLSGLTCGTSNNVTFSGENDTTAKVQLQTPLAPGQKLTCRKDGPDAYRVEDLNFQDDGSPTGENKYFGNEATVTAKVNASADESATASDPAWLRAQPALVIFKSFNGGQPRTITGVVGQKFTADYNIILTNDGYVDAHFPDIIDRPKPATGLVAKSVRVYDRAFNQNIGNLTKQDNLIVGGVADLTSDDNGASWVLAKEKLLTMKARSKGNFRLEVTYEVEQVLPTAEHSDEEYVCNKVRNTGNVNENRGLFNTIGVDEGPGLVPVSGNTRNVCYSVLRADTDVTKKINDQGEQVSDADSAEEQKNKKTIENPADADSFSVSYVIENKSKTGLKYVNNGSGEFPPSDITSVVIEDRALNDDGSVTGQGVPVEGLTCAGGDTASTVTENGGTTTVTFNPGLAAGKAVTCTGTVSVAGLNPEHIYDNVHGDRVKVTPTYDLNADEQAVSGDPTYPEPGKVTGAPVEDRAWVNVTRPSDFTITKYRESAAVVTKGEPGEIFRANYNVTVKNGSSAAGKPTAIIESPSAISGVTVTGVTAVNSQDSNNKLLVSDAPVEFHDEGDGTFTLAPTNFRNVPGSGGGNNDTSATIEVQVSYKVTAAEGIPVSPDASTGSEQPDFSELRCEGSDRTHGLFNSVKLQDSDQTGDPAPGKSDSACIDLVVPRIQVKKLIEGDDADTEEAAVAIMPGAPKVKITYAVINTGTAEITRFKINDRLSDTAEQGSSMEVVGLECNKPATVQAQGSSGVVVIPDAPLAVRTGDGGAPASGEDAAAITCSWFADNPSAMNYNDDGFHVDTASVSAKFQKANVQGAVEDITDSDSAWAVQLKSLDGTLPKSGGSGVAPYGLGALILFAGATLLSRRQRKA